LVGQDHEEHQTELSSRRPQEFADLGSGLKVQSALRGRNSTLGLRDIFAAFPAHAIVLSEYFEALMRGPSPLSAGEREMIYAYLSKENHCHFSFTSHSTCAIALGIEASAFAVPLTRVHEMTQNPQLGRALHLAVALNRPGIPRRDIDQAHDDNAEVDPALIRDVVLVTALTGLMNRLIDGVGAWAPDEMHRMNGARMAEQGYLPAAEQIRRTLIDPGHAPTNLDEGCGGSFPAFGPRETVLTWLCRFQNDILRGGPLPPSRARAVREAVAAANGLTARSSRPDVFVDYAVEVTLAPRWRGPSDSAPLYDAGATDEHVLQVVLIAALGNFLDRISVGLPQLIDRSAAALMVGAHA
jgi:alkylhydroperoxidase family enzyme